MLTIEPLAAGTFICEYAGQIKSSNSSIHSTERVAFSCLSAYSHPRMRLIRPSRYGGRVESFHARAAWRAACHRCPISRQSWAFFEPRLRANCQLLVPTPLNRPLASRPSFGSYPLRRLILRSTRAFSFYISCRSLQSSNKETFAPAQVSGGDSGRQPGTTCWDFHQPACTREHGAHCELRQQLLPATQDSRDAESLPLLGELYELDRYYLARRDCRMR